MINNPLNDNERNQKIQISFFLFILLRQYFYIFCYICNIIQIIIVKPVSFSEGGNSFDWRQIMNGLIGRTLVLCFFVIGLFISASFSPVNSLKADNPFEELSGKTQISSGEKDVDWWPCFHHDLNNTGNTTSSGPETNHLLWSYNTGYIVFSSPAVLDGKVFVGSYDHKVYCINADTGDTLWNYTTGGIVTPSPAVADGKVFIGSDDHKVYCLDADTGYEVWRYAVGDWVISSPAVANSKVYVGSYDHKVYCLDADTGDEIWNYTTGDWVISSPAVANSKVYVGSHNNKMYCLDRETGDEIWNYTTGSYVDSSPAVVNGRVSVAAMIIKYIVLVQINPQLLISIIIQ